MCRYYMRKYEQYELTITQAITCPKVYNSWVSFLFLSFYILPTHSAVITVSTELMEVNLDNIPEQLYSIY